MSNGSGYYSVGSGLHTGPASTIGSGAEFHVDINFGALYDAGRFDDIVAIMDANAMQAASKGLTIEFSSPTLYAMRGTDVPIRWDVNASPEEKMKLARDVMEAHGAHSTHKAMDFYLLPAEDASRFSSTSVEQEIPVALQDGWRVVYASGGKYGHHGIVYDENDEIMYKFGHGNDTRELPADFVATAEYKSQNSVTDVVNPQTPDASADMARGWADALDPELVRNGVENDGATKTYETLKDSIPQIFQGMDGMMGMILPLLFMAVMMASGQSVPEAVANSMDEEQRQDALQKIDKERGNTPAQPSQDGPVGDASIITPVISPTIPTAQAGRDASPVESAQEQALATGFDVVSMGEGDALSSSPPSTPRVAVARAAAPALS